MKLPQYVLFIFNSRIYIMALEIGGLCGAKVLGESEKYDKSDDNY